MPSGASAIALVVRGILSRARGKALRAAFAGHGSGCKGDRRSNLFLGQGGEVSDDLLDARAIGQVGKHDTQ